METKVSQRLLPKNQYHLLSRGRLHQNQTTTWNTHSARAMQLCADDDSPWGAAARRHRLYTHAEHAAPYPLGM